VRTCRGNIAGGKEAILRDALRLLDELITRTPEGGPVEPRRFVVPRLNSASGARIVFDLARLVEGLVGYL
jgi:hypothetical protein